MELRKTVRKAIKTDIYNYEVNTILQNNKTVRVSEKSKAGHFP